jgi:hypothetical protein
VAGVRSPFDPGASGQISPSGDIAYGVVQFDQITDNLPTSAIRAMVERPASGPPRT